MVSSKHLMRLVRLLAALGSGTALLGALLLGLRAMSASADTTGYDPQFRAITISATLPISDIAPGQGGSRTVYFNNVKADGVLTLTFDISGTPALTLTCGSGFDQITERVYTSTNSLWSPVITYSVASSHGDQDLAFTATNTNSVTTTLVLIFTQDITAPEVFIVQPSTPSAVLSTTHLPAYTVSGLITDTQAGVQAAHVLTGTGGDWRVAILSGNDWSWEWVLPKEDWEFHELRVSATDHVSNTDIATRPTYVDTMPPTNPDTPASTVSTDTWGTWTSLPLNWTAGYDGSSEISYAYALTTTWPYEVGLSDPVTTAQAIILPLNSDGVYTFCLRTRDLAGNLARETAYLGPFLRDATSPTVHVTVTRQSIGRLLVDWGDSTDPVPGSGIMAYDVYTRSGDGPLISWLPSTTMTRSVFVVPRLGVTYTFSVTASDGAGNRGQDSVQAFVSPYLYLPLAMQKYRPFVNGDFEKGDSGWDFISYPVDDGLPAQLISSWVEGSGAEQIPLGNNCVLLGYTDYPCSSTGVPVGYAAVEQTFAVPSITVPVSLTFKYVIYTQDASPSELFDRFEVYVITDNAEELKFEDGNQVSTGLSCDKWRRVPGPENPRDGSQSGWATGVIDLRPYKGQMIKISFRNYNRFDGWYNTYTYLDDVRLVTGP